MNDNIQTYKIHRWDAVLLGRSEIPIPMIYVKPDDKLLRFSAENDNAILVNIQGSESMYDNRQIVGTLRKSSDMPNSRPNFFATSGLYVIVLDADWHGYPDSNGVFSIYGVKGGVDSGSVSSWDKVDDETGVETKSRSFRTVPATIDHYNNNGNSRGMNLTRILIIIVCLFIILLAVCSCWKNK
jgi:hypothetical protein